MWSLSIQAEKEDLCLAAVLSKCSMPNSNLGPEDYLVYEVIRKSHEIDGDLPETKFHKLSFLVYKELSEQDVDVQLPVFWYEHGIMVHNQFLGDFFGTEWTRWKKRRGNRVVIKGDLEPDDFGISTSLKKQIEDAASKYVKKFKSTFDTTIVKNETYDRFADNDFIVHLNDLRYFLDEVSDVDTVDADEYAPTNVSFNDIVGEETEKRVDDFDGSDSDDVLNYLNLMVETYPWEKYDYMDDQFLEWESLTRQLAYNNMLSQLGNFTSKFWNTFSRAELRIHHNENIPGLTIRIWKRERKEHLEEFEKEIEKYRSVLLKNRESTDSLASVSEEYGQAVDDTYQSIIER